MRAFINILKRLEQVSVERTHFLTEAWFTSIDDGNGHHYDVFKNPSRAEVLKLINADKFKQARAIATATDLYVVSSDLTHFDMSQDLGLDREASARIFLDRAGPYINQDDAMATVGQEEEGEESDPWDIAQRKLVDELTTDHPILNRIYGSYKIGIR